MVIGNQASFEKWSGSNNETLRKICRVYPYKFTNKTDLGYLILF